MSSAFDFDAPQFLDLREIDRNEVESYFDTIVANNATKNHNKDNGFKINAESPIKQLELQVGAEDLENIDPNAVNMLGQKIQTPSTKQVMIEDDADDGLLACIDKLTIDSTKVVKGRAPLRATKVFEGIVLEPRSEKKHRMSTRKDTLLRTPRLSLRNRSIVKPIESEIVLSENDESMESAVSSTSIFYTAEQNKKRRHVNLFEATNNKTIESQPKKFIALAEQVANFHKETPDRYRTKPHHPWRPSMKPPALVHPKTPKLTACHRTRPVDFPDREQREQQEYEEMLKHQVKARPVNEKILKQVCLGLKVPIEKKAVTKPEPFKLTEYKPKPAEDQPVFQFKAQPIPRRILQSPCGIPPKMVKPITTPQTPRITKPVRVQVDSSTLDNKSLSSSSIDSVSRCTKVIPFSFETRNKMMLAKKEETIKKILESEKKQFSCFKAQPVRSFYCRTPVKTQTKEKTNTEEKEKVAPFKAKPATVLKQRPFYPKYPEPATPNVEAFKLKTENRALERLKFEEKMHQQELEFEKLKEEERKKQEKIELELTKSLRKQMEFKANPLPIYKPFTVHNSDVKLTQPKSPCFRSGKSLKKLNHTQESDQ